jgi:hypothetical protein
MVVHPVDGVLRMGGVGGVSAAGFNRAMGEAHLCAFVGMG